MMRKSFVVLPLILVCASARRAAAYDLIQFPPPLPVDASVSPMALAAGPDRLYVLDGKRGRVGVLSADGKLLRTAGKYGAGAEGLLGARSLTVGPDGTVFVADTGNSRIQMLDAEGKFLGHFGEKGSGPGQLDSPESVAVGSDGRVYVADTGNHRIQVFTREGVFLFGFGGKGKETGRFNGPTGVLVDDSDDVYVLDEGNNRVQKFDPRTRFMKDYPLLGERFSVDAYGFLYMLEGKRGKVKEISPAGTLLGEFGSLGSGVGQFKKPGDLAVGPDGNVLVADTGNGRIIRAQLTTKSKTARLPKNLAMKLLVSGPTSVFPYPASALAAPPLEEAAAGSTAPLKSGDIYAYLPKVGQFVALGEDGRERLRFGKKTGKDASVTSGSQGFAVSPKHGIYVADTPSHRLQRFDAKGAYQSEFAAAQGMFESRKKEGRVSSPGGVAVNEKGVVYVADTDNARVSAFSPEGAFLFSFGPKVGPHQLQEPVAVAYDDAGFVYVLDRKLKKVLKCEPSGGFVTAWGEEGTGIGKFSDPVAIAYDGRTYLYVLDRGEPRVSVFDKDGGWVTDFFARGADERSLKDPQALAVSGSRLAVSDPGMNRILTFALRPLIAPPVSVSTSASAAGAVLEWPVRQDPWISCYSIRRATQAAGPYGEVGRVKEGSFKDYSIAGPQTYYYRLAVESVTGDQGPLSQPLVVFVPASANRAAVEIATVTIGNIFSANYKWYLKNPLGKAALVNHTGMPFQSVKLSFRLKDFMDFATEQVVETLAPEQKVELPLMATLNNKILDVTEDTPIQAEFTVTYVEDGNKQSFSRAQPLKVYSRNAITWEDPRRIANFVTPKDPPVLELAREALRKAPKGPAAAENLNKDFVIAAHLWDALGALGVSFMASPNNPFEKVSEDPAFPVDYTQFPRETLKRKSGQCDDLVTLLASMLEGATVKAAVLDYPGHMAMMFDTGETEASEAGLSADLLIEHQGTLWVPLEATLVGRPIFEAIRKAAYAHREMAKAGKASIVDLRDAWQTYEPATLPMTDAPVEAPPEADTAKRFDAEAQTALELRFEVASAALRRHLASEPEDVEALNALGILCYQHGRAQEAQERFEKALSLSPADAAAANNLGSLAYAAGRYPQALERYAKAAESDPHDAGVWLNLVRASIKAGDRAKAQEYAKKAVEADPAVETTVHSLLQ
ncbi:MAG: tetratricopeptide repeat protein [Elusimicrobiota bacterium]|jgi:DNA-binding beta-propeller fold protein YncE/tetratricopeptide (TPR) repeat protein